MGLKKHKGVRQDNPNVFCRGNFYALYIFKNGHFFGVGNLCSSCSAVKLDEGKMIWLRNLDDRKGNSTHVRVDRKSNTQTDKIVGEGQR